MGAQNRQEEAPIKGKQRLERRGRNNKRKKHTSMARKGPKKKGFKLLIFFFSKKKIDLKIYIDRRRESLHICE